MQARLRPLLAGLVTVVLALTATAAVADDRDDLAAARARIDELAAELDRAVEEADGAELELADAEARLDEVEAIVNRVAQRVDEQRSAVASAETRLRDLADREAAARESVRRKAIELYKNGQRSGLLTLLTATDIEDAVTGAEYLELMDADDQAVIDELVLSGRESDAAREVLVAEEAAFASLLDEQRDVMARAEELRDSRALAAARAADEVEEAEQQHEEAEAEADRIEEAIRAAEEARRQREAEAAAARRAAAAAAAAAAAGAATSSSSSSGSSSSPSGSASSSTTSEPPPPPPPSGSGYAWPACGLVTSEYGWRWGRPHRGLDIDDTSSSDIRASNNGTVISAGWNSGGYGNLTLIDHGDGVVTAYAHQSSIKVRVGQSVSRGQSIGVIGTTGSSTGTHLHFETRVNGSAVNPRNLLSGGC